MGFTSLRSEYLSLVDGGDGPDQIRSWHTVWPVFTQAHKCNYQFGRNTPACLVRSIEMVTRHRPILPLDKQTCYYPGLLAKWMQNVYCRELVVIYAETFQDCKHSPSECMLPPSLISPCCNQLWYFGASGFTMCTAENWWWYMLKHSKIVQGDHKRRTKWMADHCNQLWYFGARFHNVYCRELVIYAETFQDCISFISQDMSRNVFIFNVLYTE